MHARRRAAGWARRAQFDRCCSSLLNAFNPSSSCSSGSASITPLTCRCGGARACGGRGGRSVGHGAAQGHAPAHSPHLRPPPPPPPQPTCLGDVVHQHVLYAPLEGDGGGGAAAAGAHHLEGDHPAVGVKGAEHNVAAVLLHRWPDARLQKLLDHGHDLRRRGVGEVGRGGGGRQGAPAAGLGGAAAPAPPRTPPSPTHTHTPRRRPRGWRALRALQKPRRRRAARQRHSGP